LKTCFGFWQEGGLDGLRRRCSTGGEALFVSMGYVNGYEIRQEIAFLGRLKSLAGLIF